LSGRGPNEALIGVPGSRRALATPSLVLDVEALDHNIASLAAHARLNHYEVRPNAKVHKSIDIARRQVAAGAIGVACATLAEAEAMTLGGVPGVMLFAAVGSEKKLARLAELNARADALVVVTDGNPTVEQFAAVARRSGRPLHVLVDIYIGGHRTGLADASRAVDLARAISETPGLEYAGVHAYVGGLKKSGPFEDRRAIVHGLVVPLVEVVERLVAAGLPPRIVSGGGTASHDIDHELGVFTENKSGSYALMDVNYAACVMRRDDAHPFLPALTVRTTVTNAAQLGFVVTDAGYKELDAVHGVAPAVIRGADPSATYSMVGDDMGRIDFEPPARPLDVGDAVEVLPPHCYLTLTMYSQYHVVRGEDLIDIWPVYSRDNW